MPSVRLETRMNQKQVRPKFSATNIRPISRTTISDEIIEQIMTLIERGELQPGQRLPSERELCLRFGIGRSSLREALRCLAIVGVLNARVGEGTTVAADNARFLKVLQWRMVTEQHDIEDLMQVRIALEGLTASNVALNSTASDIRALQSLLDQMDGALDDHRRFRALDVEFHLALARISGNSLALDLITMVSGNLAKTLGRMLNLPNARPLSLEEHSKIVHNIELRDAEGARSAMYAHLQAALDRYKQAAAKRSKRRAAPVQSSLSNP